MTTLNRVGLLVADTRHLNFLATSYHYMERSVSYRSCPFGWVVTLDGQEMDDNGIPFGFIMFSSIHYTKLRNEFGYEGLPTKWQVLSLSRLWIHPCLQDGGKYYSSEYLPGYVDRKGVWRSTLATSIMKETHCMVQKRWLEVHPPRFPEQPYHIRKIISYADTRYFAGIVYQQGGYREYGRVRSMQRNKSTRGIEMNGAELICYIHDLPEPEWIWGANQ